MASRSALIALLAVASCAAVASAVTINVGDAQGWNLGVDYTAWASGKTFSPNDTLVFTFTNAHNVAEVNPSDYTACTTGSATNDMTNSPVSFTLTPGMHYYLCTVPNHCTGGMKLAVNVGAGSGGSPTPATPATPGTPPTTPSPAGPNGASARLQAAGPALAVAAGVLVKLALF